MKTDTIFDKSDWGEGPWQSEPDRVQWTDEATGLVCLVKRNGRVTGALCGYVGVPPGHPAHGLTASWDDERHSKIDVHGGVTYGAECDDDPQLGICHVPEPGQADHLWWIGFDCAHCWDMSPRMNAQLPADLRLRDETYRTVDYVKAECIKLASQLNRF